MIGQEFKLVFGIRDAIYKRFIAPVSTFEKMRPDLERSLYLKYAYPIIYKDTCIKISEKAFDKVKSSSQGSSYEYRLRCIYLPSYYRILSSRTTVTFTR